MTPMESLVGTWTAGHKKEQKREESLLLDNPVFFLGLFMEEIWVIKVH